MVNDRQEGAPVDASWLYDVKLTHGVGVCYDFDAAALEVDEGWQRLIDELRHRTELRIRAIEVGELRAVDWRPKYEVLMEIRRDYARELEPLVRGYGAFLGLYGRPFLIASSGMGS
jgi:hypothetical protein